MVKQCCRASKRRYRMAKQCCRASKQRCRMTKQSCRASKRRCRMTKQSCRASKRRCRASKRRCRMTKQSCRASKRRCRMTKQSCRASKRRCRRRPPILYNVVRAACEPPLRRRARIVFPVVPASPPHVCTPPSLVIVLSLVGVGAAREPPPCNPASSPRHPTLSLRNPHRPRTATPRLCLVAPCPHTATRCHCSVARWCRGGS